MIFIGDDFNTRIVAQNELMLENGKDLIYLPQYDELNTIRPVSN